jgi:riboflavin synthase
MSSRVVHVEIHGQRYAIRSKLDPQYIGELSAYLDEKMRAAARELASTDPLRIAVIAALNISDEVFKARADGNLRRLTIYCHYPRTELVEGASIACSGVCMTVVDTGHEDALTWFAVDAADETLRVTTVGRWHQGNKVNLERPLKLGDEMGGHMVAGHVDGIANVVAREDMTDMARFVLRTPQSLARFIATKGSVALDGVSLTVNSVEDDIFSVLVIPHTLQVTTLSALQKGDIVNLEVDTIARYAARLIEAGR